MGAVEVCLRVAVGVVFLLAVVSKVSRRRREDFRAAVEALVPTAGARLVGGLVVVTIVVEWGVVVLLWAVPGRIGGIMGFGLAGAALTVFTIVVMLGLRRGVSVPCQCFGSSDRPISGAQLVRNLVLQVLVALGLVFCLTVRGGGVPVMILCVAAGAGAVLGIVLSVFDDLVDLFFVSPAYLEVKKRGAVPGRKFP